MNYVLVGIGGAFGSITRYAIGKLVAQRIEARFPYGTLIINITGAILLGIVSTLGTSVSWQLLLADGFLGAYTTFSTFMYEGFNLFKDRNMLNAFIYIIGSLFLGVIGFFIGTQVTYFV
jgi:fluoride exporter